MSRPADGSAIAGNVFDKYASRHPIERWMVSRFLRAVEEMASASGAREALEVGCGEGQISRLLARRGMKVRATDASPSILDEARRLTPEENVEYSAAAIETLRPETHAAPLVVAIEVLEHVDDADACLRRLAALARPHALISVPQEPLWRLLNMARGRYLGDFGNTPGHLHHWSPGAFRRLVSHYFSIEQFRRPLPWSIILARV